MPLGSPTGEQSNFDYVEEERLHFAYISRILAVYLQNMFGALAFFFRFVANCSFDLVKPTKKIADIFWLDSQTLLFVFIPLVSLHSVVFVVWQ